MSSSIEKEELNKIADAWITGSEAESGTHEYNRNWWALERVMNWSLDKEPQKLWQFVLTVYKRDFSDKVLSVLAAGPLEDLLAHYGTDYIEQVERLAETDEKFNLLLGGVWRNCMTDEVWNRVQAIRKEVW
jgi:hypothetical protein